MFDKPSDHGQFRDGETQTRASHRISHDPKDYLALVLQLDKYKPNALFEKQEQNSNNLDDSPLLSN
ncbi:hypothetical protein LXL04_038378 [Taraxacum kok-saghyz]